MFVIIVYDTHANRSNQVRQYLRQQLTWVQNSVFEGDITEAQFRMIRATLKQLINEAEDSIIYYLFQSRSRSKRGILGQERNSTDNFI